MKRSYVIFLSLVASVCGFAVHAQDVVGGALQTSFSYGPAVHATILILDNPFNADGQINTVAVDIFAGSASTCPAGDTFNVRVFRPNSSPAYALVDERGPFNETPGTQVIALSSPITVQRGDVLGFYENASTTCSLGGGYGSQFRTMYIPADYHGGSVGFFVDAPSLGYSIRASSSPSAYIGTLPGVGVTGGAAGSSFNTLVTMTNPNFKSVTLQFAFHPNGSSGSSPLPTASVTLDARAAKTMKFQDLFPGAGIGSVDVYSNGPAPALNARVYNQPGTGTNGFTESLVIPNGPQIAHDFDNIWLTMPADFTAFRMNIGVRALGGGAQMTCQAINAAGANVASTSKTYAANWTSLETLQGFFDGNAAAVTAGGSIHCAVAFPGGSKNDVILYGTVTDNTTNDSALFFAERR